MSLSLDNIIQLEVNLIIHLIILSFDLCYYLDCSHNMRAIVIIYYCYHLVHQFGMVLTLKLGCHNILRYDVTTQHQAHSVVLTLYN